MRTLLTTSSAIARFSTATKDEASAGTGYNQSAMGGVVDMLKKLQDQFEGQSSSLVTKEKTAGAGGFICMAMTFRG